MDIRLAVTHHSFQQKFGFPDLDPLFELFEAALFILGAAPKEEEVQRSGRRSGALARLKQRENHPLLLSILLANVQSLNNKVNKFRARISFQRDIRDCNILCFTESWLSPDILSPSIQPVGFSVHHADRKKELSGIKKGGGGYFMINNSWCDCVNLQELKSFCSPDMEYLTIKCRPH